MYAKSIRVPLEVLKRILIYLEGTLEYGLYMRKSHIFNLMGFCDVDWALDPNER